MVKMLTVEGSPTVEQTLMRVSQLVKHLICTSGNSRERRITLGEFGQSAGVVSLLSTIEMEPALTRIGDSEIHGRGLFAAQDIPEGSFVTTFPLHGLYSKDPALKCGEALDEETPGNDGEREAVVPPSNEGAAPGSDGGGVPESGGAAQSEEPGVSEAYCSALGEASEKMELEEVKPSERSLMTTETSGYSVSDSYIAARGGSYAEALEDFMERNDRLEFIDYCGHSPDGVSFFADPAIENEMERGHLINDAAALEDNSQDALAAYLETSVKRANCKLVFCGPIAAVITTRKVACGEELLRSYGAQWWEGRNQHGADRWM